MGGSKPSNKHSKVHNSQMVDVCVSVVGLSGGEQDKGAIGIGKSCLCNRFVRQSLDEYRTDHISVFSQSDFSGRVVNNDHFLYWGSVKRTTSDGLDLNIKVIEQTEFYDDSSFQPFSASNNKGGGSSAAFGGNDYIKRCLSTKLYSPEKLMYICKDQLGVESEFEQNVMMDPSSKDKYLKVDAFLIIFDVSRVPDRPIQTQLDTCLAIMKGISMSSPNFSNINSDFKMSPNGGSNLNGGSSDKSSNGGGLSSRLSKPSFLSGGNNSNASSTNLSAHPPVMVLVATKCDEADEVMVRQLESLINRREFRHLFIPVIETSSFESVNVDLAFLAAACLATGRSAIMNPNLPQSHNMLGTISGGGQIHSGVGGPNGSCHIVSYMEAAHSRRSLLDAVTEGYIHVLRTQVTSYTAQWPSTLKRMQGVSPYLNYVHLFGFESSRRLFHKHVAKLKDEFLGERVQFYLEKLPYLIQNMFPQEYESMLDEEFPSVKERILDHPDRDCYFSYPDSWMDAELLLNVSQNDVEEMSLIPIDILDMPDAETVFRHHIQHLHLHQHRNELRHDFKRLLYEMGCITPGKVFDEVKVLFLGRECFENLPDMEIIQLYEAHQQDLIAKAKRNFQELLWERADLFSGYSHSPVGTMTQDDILEITLSLQEDSRWKALDRLDSDRKLILFQHLGFVHCPIQEHCPSGPDHCVDTLITDYLTLKCSEGVFEQQQRGCQGGGGGVNVVSVSHLNITVLSSPKHVGSIVISSIKSLCNDNEEFRSGSKSYSLNFRLIDGNISLQQNAFITQDFLPNACMAVYSDQESLEYICECVDQSMYSTFTPPVSQTDENTSNILPFDNLPLVIVFAALPTSSSLPSSEDGGNIDLDSTQTILMGNLRMEGQKLAASIGCSFVHGSIEMKHEDTYQESSHSCSDWIGNSIIDLIDQHKRRSSISNPSNSIHSTGLLNLPPSSSAVSQCVVVPPPDISIVMCLFCGDPYPISSVIDPILYHTSSAGSNSCNRQQSTSQPIINNPQLVNPNTIQFCTYPSEIFPPNAKLTSTKSSQIKVRISFLSYHCGAQKCVSLVAPSSNVAENDVNASELDNLVHGYVLVYAAGRKASLANLSTFSLSISEIPLLKILAVPSVAQSELENIETPGKRAQIRPVGGATLPHPHSAGGGASNNQNFHFNNFQTGNGDVQNTSDLIVDEIIQKQIAFMLDEGRLLSERLNADFMTLPLLGGSSSMSTSPHLSSCCDSNILVENNSTLNSIDFEDSIENNHVRNNDEENCFHELRDMYINSNPHSSSIQRMKRQRVRKDDKREDVLYLSPFLYHVWSNVDSIVSAHYNLRRQSSNQHLQSLSSTSCSNNSNVDDHVSDENHCSEDESSLTSEGSSSFCLDGVELANTEKVSSSHSVSHQCSVAPSKSSRRNVINVNHHSGTNESSNLKNTHTREIEAVHHAEIFLGDKKVKKTHENTFKTEKEEKRKLLKNKDFHDPKTAGNHESIINDEKKHSIHISSNNSKFVFNSTISNEESPPLAYVDDYDDTEENLVNQELTKAISSKSNVFTSRQVESNTDETTRKRSDIADRYLASVSSSATSSGGDRSTPLSSETEPTSSPSPPLSNLTTSVGCHRRRCENEDKSKIRSHIKKSNDESTSSAGSLVQKRREQFLQRQSSFDKKESRISDTSNTNNRRKNEMKRETSSNLLMKNHSNGLKSSDLSIENRRKTSFEKEKLHLEINETATSGVENEHQINTSTIIQSCSNGVAKIKIKCKATDRIENRSSGDSTKSEEISKKPQVPSRNASCSSPSPATTPTTPKSPSTIGSKEESNIGGGKRISSFMAHVKLASGSGSSKKTGSSSGIPKFESANNSPTVEHRNSFNGSSVNNRNLLLNSPDLQPSNKGNLGVKVKGPEISEALSERMSVESSKIRMKQENNNIKDNSSLVKNSKSSHSIQSDKSSRKSATDTSNKKKGSHKSKNGSKVSIVEGGIDNSSFVRDESTSANNRSNGGFSLSSLLSRQHSTVSSSNQNSSNTNKQFSVDEIEKENTATLKVLQSMRKDGDPEIVPCFLKQTMTYLESLSGSETEGLYRVPGSRTHVDALYSKFHKDKTLDQSYLKELPVNAVGTAVKDFISKKLPSLLNKAALQQLQMLSKNEKDDDSLVNGLKDLLSKLPVENVQILKFIFQHFVKISMGSETNCMDSKNLAICFWPTLFHFQFEDLTQFELMRNNMECVVQLIIDKFHLIF